MPQPINISASRGAAILGLSQYQTPVSVWLQIMEARDPGFCKRRGYVMPEFEYNSAMKWGHAFESAVIELAESLAPAFKIIDREKYYEKDFLTCHIDGRYVEKAYGIPDELHEGKTTGAQTFRENWGEPGTDRIPQDYQIQVQHQMICTGAEKVIVSVLVFPKRVEEWEAMGWKVVEKIKKIGGEYYIVNDSCSEHPSDWAFVLNQMGYFHQYHVPANPELQELMIKRYAEFWNNNVLTGTPPEPISYDDIKALCPAPVGTVIANDEITRLMAEYKNIGQEISASGPLAKRREQIKVEVLKYMTGAAGVPDDESLEKIILRGSDGKKLAQYNGKMFR